MQAINETINGEHLHKYLHKKAKQLLEKHQKELDKKPVLFLPAGTSGEGKKWGELSKYGRRIKKQ